MENRIIENVLETWEEKYRHARNPDASEQCPMSCDIRHDHHYHSLSIDKQKTFLRQTIESALKEQREEMDRIITGRMRIFASTPLSERPNAFDAMKDCRNALIKKLSE